ncbi:zf-HC2 domain-containing protein [Micromonospora sp. CPCC 206060]|uniref:zf-HC2 domain-containing protein n=1 Tax=Micromonospora sp. CPCC 206060 TaxID=3122406 RepID=UPI002FEE71FB
MGCEQWREILSAQLDGEETRAERAAADTHLAGCTACRQWFDRAAAVTRRVRLSPASPGVDLTDSILATMPRPTASRVRDRLIVGLRGALGLVGALQLVLGLAQIGRGPAAAHVHAGSGVLASGHLWHEAAAWNVAVGAGFLFVAARRTAPTGLLPTLSTFVGTLVLLSVNDLVTGRVAPDRLVSHGFLLAGYAVVVALSRLRSPRLDGPSGRSRPKTPGWRLPDDAEVEAPTLRLLPPHPGSARVHDRWAA